MSRTHKRAGMAFGVAIGGKAIVCCVHDRQKRVVTTEAHVAALGLAADSPIIYDPRIHKVHRCTCCENLFVDTSDEPRYCHQCNRVPVHALGGPLPLPGGVVDG